jgi:hypothetical protein
LLKGDPLTAFLNGAGGTGNSQVIKCLVKYAKRLCHNLEVRYTRRTIVVTALTGAAAVGIRGETTHSSIVLNRQTPPTMEEIEEWKHAYLVVVDKISFSGKKELQKIHFSLGRLREDPSQKFGGMGILFSGDLSQLDPVKGTLLHKEEDNRMWDKWVHTFFELGKNHRFKDDKKWGELLGRFRDTGPRKEDVKLINSRVIDSPNGPCSNDIPVNAVYATKTNMDRMATNDSIFAKHVANSCSQDANTEPPKHTICIKPRI